MRLAVDFVRWPIRCFVMLTALVVAAGFFVAASLVELGERLARTHAHITTSAHTAIESCSPDFSPNRQCESLHFKRP